MANRGDMNSKFPRNLKRKLAMGEARGYIASPTETSFTRKLMIDAHASYVAYKHKRSELNNRDTDDIDAG